MATLLILLGDPLQYNVLSAVRVIVVLAGGGRKTRPHVGPGGIGTGSVQNIFLGFVHKNQREPYPLLISKNVYLNEI